MGIRLGWRPFGPPELCYNKQFYWLARCFVGSQVYGIYALICQELLLAEQWARKNKLKFPPIEADLQYKRDGMKEFYVFQDPVDPTCPIVIHFVLANRTFKAQMKPGIALNCFCFVVVACCCSWLDLWKQCVSLHQMSYKRRPITPSDQKIGWENQKGGNKVGYSSKPLYHLCTRKKAWPSWNFYYINIVLISPVMIYI